MKLSSRYNRVNLITSLIILLFTGVSYYFMIHYILTDQLDKDLVVEENEIIDYAHTYGKLPLPGDYKDQKVEYLLVTSDNSGKRKFENTVYRNQTENETEPGRKLVTMLQFNNRLYQITITKSRVEAEDLISLIFFITLGITALLLISLILINRFILSRLWKPFYTVLDQMKAFDIADKNEINADVTNIDEFNELNKAAISMSKRVKQDYTDLKSFTDNASHEMMTPLAVINSKLDTLLQGESLSNSQGELIDDMYDAIGRLTRLNHSLLLLTKIENNLINDQETVDLRELISQKLRQFQELIHAKYISVQQETDAKELVMSKYLADILLNNLISNAIRHNHDGGKIQIQLTRAFLRITNSSHEPALNIEKIFDRFNKSSSSEGMGLGLAISRQICTANAFKLEYKYTGEEHSFIVSF